MPSMELFDKQSAEYKEAVLPSAVRKRVAMEAASSFGWAKYVGLDGTMISIDHYGASGQLVFCSRSLDLQLKRC